jgi:hypothetical protein
MTEPQDREGADGSGPETDRGRAIFEELLWVHSIIRRDLEVVEQLAADVGEELPGDAVENALGELNIVEAAARALTDTDGGDARRRVIDGLHDLHVHLLEHLDFEERHAGPTMRRLNHFASA